MRTLIIGGSGAIGAAVARHTSAIGIETHVGVRATSRLDRLASCADVRRHLFELGEPDSMLGLIEAARPDWIVMTAFPTEGHASDDRSRRNLLHGMTTGLLGLLAALKATEFAGSLTWIGSAMCYGQSEKIRRCDDVLRPDTFRGAVKAAESVLARQMAADLGIRLTELRVFTGYGPFEQRERLVSSLLRAGLSGARVPLAASPARRDWIHYDDIAAACVASTTPALPSQRVFNVCSGQTHDTREVAGLLEQITGKRLIADHAYEQPERYGNAQPGELPSGDGGLDWSPRIGLPQGLERCWRWACSTEGRNYLLQQGQVAA